ncbi:MAG: hypothetical protein HQK92_02955 [Nitrospirae bacterium]|nr:hypothetical protein [Nitrospirota bacterium]
MPNLIANNVPILTKLGFFFIIPLNFNIAGLFGFVVIVGIAWFILTVIVAAIVGANIEKSDTVAQDKAFRTGAIIAVIILVFIYCNWFWGFFSYCLE